MGAHFFACELLGGGAWPLGSKKDDIIGCSVRQSSDKRHGGDGWYANSNFFASYV